MNRLVFARAGALALALGLGSYVVLQASLSGCDAATETTPVKEPRAVTAEPALVELPPPPSAPTPAAPSDAAPGPAPSAAAAKASASAPVHQPPASPPTSEVHLLPATKSGMVFRPDADGGAPRLQRQHEPPPQPPPQPPPPPPAQSPNAAPR